MAKAIINKHIENLEGVDLTNIFNSDTDKNKGEIIICNDPSNPTIYIMDSKGSPRKIASEGGNVDTTPEEIIVAGLEGQLGAGNYTNGSVIPAGTNIYEIIQNILCRELYPTSVNAKTASATATMNDLILKLNKSGTIEVGTLVTLIEGKTNSSNVSVTQNSQITGMTYGYSSEDDDERDTVDTSITSNCVTQLKDNIYTISAKINKGFNVNENINIPEAKTGEGAAELAETIIGCVSEGDNEITISASGPIYSYNADAIDKVYYCSNLGKTDASQYHPGVDAVNNETTRPSKTATANITGAYRYFMGYSTNTSYDQFDSESIRNLNLKQNWINKDSVTTIVDSNTMKSNGESIVIACPNSYKLTTIENPPADLLPLFLSSGSGSDGIVKVKCGEIDVDYHVYVYPITNGAKVDFKNVTLTKK